MILSTHQKQKSVNITLVGYLLEKHDDQTQSKAVNSRLSPHFFAASNSISDQGHIPLHFFITRPLNITKETEREETGEKAEGHYTNYYYGGKREKKIDVCLFVHRCISVEKKTN